MRLCQCGGLVVLNDLTRGRESWACRACGRYQVFPMGQAKRVIPPTSAILQSELPHLEGQASISRAPFS